MIFNDNDRNNTCLHKVTNLVQNNKSLTMSNGRINNNDDDDDNDDDDNLKS